MRFHIILKIVVIKSINEIFLHFDFDGKIKR